MNNRGSVLIIVLWSLFFLAMLAVAVHAYVMPYAELSGKLLNKTQMHYFANAGVERAIFEVENDDTELYDSVYDSWSNNDEAFRHVAINGGEYSAIKDATVSDEEPQYGLMDEEAKININKASQEVLKNLFEKVAQVESEEAGAIADSIIDWRDKDDVIHKDGKENDYYQSLAQPYDCKNGDFEAEEELLWVGGVTPEMFEKIKVHITLYGDGAVNVNTASVPVLMSLGLDEALAEKVVHFRSGSSPVKGDDIPENVFADAGSIAGLLDKAEHLSGEEIALIQSVVPLLGVRSNNFRGYIVGSFGPGGKTEKIVFVYDRQEKIVKYWREG
ncbi:MAG: type II secretion system protein GspK [Candidatus Omnitrophica bacterium]|nr:type II secretion system protein GspK [Candidatus Omnitrophota bacterium]